MKTQQKNDLTLKKQTNKKKYQTKNIALIRCNIITGRLEDKIIENEEGVVLIRNSLLKFVGKRHDIEIPNDYEIINLHGKYLLPGLINAHCHLSGSGKPTKLLALDQALIDKIKFILKLWVIKKLIYRMMKKNLITNINAGITTIRTLGDLSYLDIKLRKKIENGKFIGPRIIAAGKSICITGGHGALAGLVADSKVEVRKAIRQNLRNEVDVIKIISTGGVMDARKIGEAGRPQMTIEEIETACFEAHRGNILVASHCESALGIDEALTGGVDTIEHGAPISDLSLKLFKNNPKSLRGFSSIIPTISAGMALATLPRKITKISEGAFENSKIVIEGQIEGLKRAYKEKIKIGIGNDASVPYNTHYSLWNELKYFLHYIPEMTNKEAIHFATLGNAEILGIENLTGSLEKGKSADIIILEKNPIKQIEALSKVNMVIIKGYLLKHPKIKKIKTIERNPIINPY